MAMEIFSKPGSLTMFSTARRAGLPAPSDCPPDLGPASYSYDNSCIPHRQETVAPFDTTAIRNELKPNGFPSPCEYYPNQRPRHESGTPLIGAGPRFPDDNYCSDSPGPIYKLLDPWAKTLRDIQMLATTKRPRIQSERFVSNNAPSVFNTLDMKQYIKGMDGRMYPWWKKRPTSPGPKYDVSNIYTSKSPGPYQTDFTNSSKRPPIFKIIPGFGPADFNTRVEPNCEGGELLSKTDEPTASIPRYFDMIVCHSRRDAEISPAKYYPKGAFDKPSPKAVSAPFKSTVPTLGHPKKPIGPGPAAYFEDKGRMQDIDPPIIGYCFSEVPEKAPFDTSEERFFTMNYHEELSRPAPCDYNIYGFGDMMRYNLCRHAPATINPKLGFLTSAEARPELFKGLTMTLAQPREIPGQWQNIRPKKIRTYNYNGAPEKPGSPGPGAYDTRSGFKFLKAQKSWWNPREFNGSGFNNSGCGRSIKLNIIDYDNPGPKYGTWSEFPGPGGNIKRNEARFAAYKSEGPGPRHKPSEKTESMWRATQLGTCNVFLKGIDRVLPTAGGYHPHGGLDALGDRQRGFIRLDDYADEINPKTPLDDIVKLEYDGKPRKQLKYSSDSTAT